MLKYNDLTKAQKRFVDCLLTVEPQAKKTGTVTRKQIEAAYWELQSKRAAGGEKVGFPNWLTGPNKISRGLYQVPMPVAVKATAKAAEVAERKSLEAIVDESDEYTSDEFNPEDEEARMVMAEIAGR